MHGPTFYFKCDSADQTKADIVMADEDQSSGTAKVSNNYV